MIKANFICILFISFVTSLVFAEELPAPKEYPSSTIIERVAKGVISSNSFCANPQHYKCDAIHGRSTLYCTPLGKVKLDNPRCMGKKFKLEAFLEKERALTQSLCEKSKVPSAIMGFYIPADFDCELPMKKFKKIIFSRVSQAKALSDKLLKTKKKEIDDDAKALVSLYWRCPRNIDFREDCIPEIVDFKKETVLSAYGLPDKRSEISKRYVVSGSTSRFYVKNNFCLASSLKITQMPGREIKGVRSLPKEQENSVYSGMPEYAHCYSEYNKIFDEKIEEYIAQARGELKLKETQLDKYAEFFNEKTSQDILNLFIKEQPEMVFKESSSMYLGEVIGLGVKNWIVGEVDDAVYRELLCAGVFKGVKIKVPACSSMASHHYYNDYNGYFGHGFSKLIPKGMRIARKALCRKSYEGHIPSTGVYPYPAPLGLTKKEMILCDQATIGLFRVLRERAIDYNKIFDYINSRKIDLVGKPLNFRSVLNEKKIELEEIFSLSKLLSAEIYFGYYKFDNNQASSNYTASNAVGSQEAPVKTVNEVIETGVSTPPLAEVWNEKTEIGADQKEIKELVSKFRGKVRNQVKLLTGECFSKSRGVNDQSSFDAMGVLKILAKCEAQAQREVAGCLNEEAFGDTDCSRYSEINSNTKKVRELIKRAVIR